MKVNWTSIGCGMLFSLSLLTSGCETVLEWPANVVPRLTIISHLTPDSWEQQRVYVYASKSPLDSTQFYSPYNIKVEVTELETDLKVTLDSTREGNKVYFAFPEGFFKSGFSYGIRASAPGFESVHATTDIPEPSYISDLTIKDIHIEPSQKHEFKSIVRYKVVFKIINTIESEHYYHLVFYNEYGGSPSLYWIDPELSDEQPFLPHYAYGVLIDPADLVEGEPLEFNFTDWILENNELNTVYVELRTISEEYYKYHSTLARQVIVRKDPFAEPVTIFNNIDGGYGNFSGFSSNISSSDLPK